MELVFYRGAPVATATARRVFLAPDIEARSRDDPERRFILGMCLYGVDVAAGELDGPYDDQEAALYARMLLVDDDAFREHEHESDVELAARFGVPIEQIAAKRADLRGEGRPVSGWTARLAAVAWRYRLARTGSTASPIPSPEAEV